VSNADDYSNALEQMFAHLPGWLQAPLRPAYDEIDGLLRQVAGNPPELIEAGDRYAALAAKISQIADEQATDRAKLISGHWHGQAYESFSAVTAGVETQLQTFAKAMANTQPVLTSAAQACTEGADAICQIVGTLITWLISSLVVNLALAFFTFGVSLAADVAEALGATADALVQIGAVTDRVATVLERVAALLKKIAEILNTVQRVLLIMLRGVDTDAGTYNDSINLVKLLYSKTNPLDAAFPGGAGAFPNSVYSVARLVVGLGEVVAAREVIDKATLDSLHLPKTFSEGHHTLSSVVRTVKDAHTAEHEAATPTP
jgi:uncharacterized protein YukE